MARLGYENVVVVVVPLHGKLLGNLACLPFRSSILRYPTFGTVHLLD